MWKPYIVSFLRDAFNDLDTTCSEVDTESVTSNYFRYSVLLSFPKIFVSLLACGSALINLACISDEQCVFPPLRDVSNGFYCLGIIKLGMYSSKHTTPCLLYSSESLDEP